MTIQAHQVRNVLRTYGHLKSLQINQIGGDRKQNARTLPDALTLSEESRTQENTEQDLPGERDARVDL
ncbi:hypothetical protein MNBD_NITROSPIRAE01-1655 [hydrothermal vent metagenome]|uniref:Uncharacterized protein n=1 Tax=hydrothermal vent metagenome TaxID=652676 RepID=A0A3B1CUV5_9ZZZZ